ncbi:antitoxin VbhA family protein [Mesorhizobium cantuariense]|uniref:Antitoxin VbhA family protein n=1 Tax=Mesorhizobium cantuariense TaxID=1300275 RepID=A0ABV7MG15_9HYPH
MGKIAVKNRSMDDSRLSESLNPGSFGKHSRHEDMRQIAAISEFEGLTPSPAFKALRERYISGEISIKEFRKEIDSRWKRNG